MYALRALSLSIFLVSLLSDSFASRDTIPLLNPDTVPAPIEIHEIAPINSAEALENANNLYIQGDFDQAVTAYQQLVDSGYYSMELFYNLGNTYFKLNQLPRAILNYERAFMLNPTDEDVLFNLELAQSLTVDRIEELPEFFLVSWYRSVRRLLSSNQWAIISLLLIAATLSLALLFWFSRTSGAKRISFAGAILTLLLAIIAMVFSAQERNKLQSRDRAVIFAPVVAIKSSPGNTGKDIFILHAGTRVQISNSLGDWLEIRIADGNKGWLPKSAVEVVQIW